MPTIEFNPKATTFDIHNAYYLANLAQLAYGDLSQIGSILKNDYALDSYVFVDDKKADTQVFLASGKDILVLSFRGTTNLKDWLTNINILTAPSAVGVVHAGFNAALNAVWEKLYDKVMSTKRPGQRFWITGHSLGGALATLAADRFSEENIQLVDAMYTFGQPRVGDRKFQINFDRKMRGRCFRLVDDEDIVTKVPFPPGYKHVGCEYFIDHKGQLHETNTFWAWWKSASESVEMRSNKDAYNRRMQNPGGIYDHSTSNYIKYLNACIQMQKPKGKSFSDYIK